MSSNYSIIIDKGEHHGDYVRHVFRALFSGPKSNINRFVERTKDNWYTGTEFIAVELLQNYT